MVAFCNISVPEADTTVTISKQYIVLIYHGDVTVIRNKTTKYKP